MFFVFFFQKRYWMVAMGPLQMIRTTSSRYSLSSPQKKRKKKSQLYIKHYILFIWKIRKMWICCIKLALMLTDFRSHGHGFCLVRYRSEYIFVTVYNIHEWNSNLILLFCLLGGDLKGGINQAGIDYYNNLINQLLSKGNDSLFLL